MGNLLTRLRSGLVLISIVFIVLGVALIIWPSTSMNIIVYLLGALVLLLGIVRLIAYFSTNVEISNKFYLFEGIVFCFAGLMMLFFANQVIEIITYVFGVYLIFDGIMNLQKGFDLKKSDYNPYKIIMVCGAITIVVGIIFLAKPFDIAKTLVLIMGIVLVYDGLVNLYVAFCTHQVKKYIDKVNAYGNENVIETEVVERIEHDD